MKQLDPVAVSRSSTVSLVNGTSGAGSRGDTRNRGNQGRGVNEMCNPELGQHPLHHDPCVDKLTLDVVSYLPIEPRQN